MKTKHPSFTRHCGTPSLTALALAWALLPAAHAAMPQHQISAGNITVTQIDTADTTNSVTTAVSLSINDFRVRGSGVEGTESLLPLISRGDFPVQIGDDATNDFAGGILMASITQNGRDNGEGTGPNYCASMIESQRALTNEFDPTIILGAYYISAFTAAGSQSEYNINVAGAWFPYSQYLGGFARNSGNDYGGSPTNAGAMNQLISSPQLVLGVNFIDNGGGRSHVTLTNLAIDSRLDGVLLVSGAKDENANFGLCQVNRTNGGWNLFIRDIGTANPAGFEQDPIAFVFIPKTNTTVVSGRFRGDASIEMFSGSSPQFLVTSNDAGTYELKINGRPGAPTNGVLILSAEGGAASNQNNMVSYEMNATADGWIIQSRDTPSAALEEIPADEPVVSFAYIPGPTPGVTLSAAPNLHTSENGAQATFTVVLDTPPAADVTIDLASSNTGEGTVSPASLTFTSTDWNTPQTVTITGVDDAVADGSVAYSITLAAAVSTDPDYSGLDPDDVSVVNTDNELGITVSPTTGLTTTEAGATATFAVSLNTEPAADVTIDLSSSDTTEATVSPASLTFTTANWNTAQTVTVTGVDDVVEDGDVAFTIVTAPAVSVDPNYNGLNAPDVSGANLDNDAAGITTSIGLNLFPVLESKSVSYTVVLNAAPAADVTVDLVSSDTALGGTVSPATLTFTPANWDTPQTVTLTGADDFVVDGSNDWYITNSISSTDPLYTALPPFVVWATTLNNDQVVTMPSGDRIYGTGQPGVGLDGWATIEDPNSPDYNAATLTVTLAANGTADDRLEVRNSGTSPGQIGVSGATVTFGGTEIATLSGGSGTTPLVVTFNAASTPAAAQELLRSVTFRTLDTQLPQDPRSVSVVLARPEGFSTTNTTAVRVGLLRVTEFQQGADYGYGLYSGEADTELREAAPDTAYPAGHGAQGLFIDWPDATGGNWAQVLMRFDDIIGDAYGQIPTNAVIVSAELVLRIPPEDSNGQGDGSPLFRMLIPWDASTDTWNSMTGGISQNNVESRSSADSQLHTAGTGGNTGTGTVSTGVTPDLLAWLGGATNYGWVMPGWPTNRDGTTIRPGETPVISERPHLRVLWLPETGASLASFRQNVNGYTQGQDTLIVSSTPDLDKSADATLWVDWSAGGTPDTALIKFDGIIGTGAGQIPPNSQVHVAVLDVASVVNNAPGDGGQFYAMLMPWDQANTWNYFVDGISPDGIEAALTPSLTLGTPAFTPQVQGGYHTYDFTADVQDWVNGTRANYGWAVFPWSDGTDGWGISSDNTGTTKNRPQLRVYYTAPPVLSISSIARTASSATIEFTGEIGTAYTILRSDTVNGSFTSIGSATVQPDGKATFTDNSPLPDAAFYRIQYP